MGKLYEPKKRETRRQMHLTFDEGHEFHGAEIDVWLSGVPISLYLELSGMMGRGVSGEEAVAVFGPLLREFADSCLISWNLGDNGEPVPANGEGLLRQEADLVIAILTGWMKAAGEPGTPLAETSSGGSTSGAG